jgi:hypothetical protein
MKVPYEDIDKVCDLAEETELTEADHLAICRIRSWLVARAKRSLDNQVKSMKKPKRKKS